MQAQGSGEAREDGAHEEGRREEEVAKRLRANASSTD